MKKVAFLSSFIFFLLLSIAFKINDSVIEWFWEGTQFIGFLLMALAVVFLVLVLVLREEGKRKNKKVSAS